MPGLHHGRAIVSCACQAPSFVSDSILLGLIPGIGDTSSAMVSALLLDPGVRLRRAQGPSMRMALNHHGQRIIGIIPGDRRHFSFWFKSNARNHELSRRTGSARNTPSRSDWAFVIAILALLVLIVCVANRAQLPGAGRTRPSRLRPLKWRAELCDALGRQSASRLAGARPSI